MLAGGITTWVLIVTLWAGPNPEQEKHDYSTFQECKDAGIAWILEKQKQYGKDVRYSAYCREVAYQNLYGQRDFHRIPFGAQYHNLPNR